MSLVVRVTGLEDVSVRGVSRRALRVEVEVHYVAMGERELAAGTMEPKRRTLRFARGRGLLGIQVR